VITPALPPAGDLLTVTATGDATCRRVRAAGEVDASSAPQIAAAVEAALAGGARQLLLDLSEVTFLGTAGVHALLGAHRRASEAAVALRTRVGRAAVRLPLQSSGAWRLLEVEWTPTHARS
jgi:anti-anti-sigma factor